MNLRKDALWNTIGNFAYLGALWLMSMLVVRLSGFVDAGRLSVAMTSANVYVSLASYTLRLYFAADITKKYSDEQYCLTRFVTTLLSILICVVVTVVIGYSKVQLEVIFLFYLYKAEEMLSDILYGVMQRGGKLYISGYSMILKALLSLVLFVVILGTTKNLVFALQVIVIAGVGILFLFDYPLAKKVSGNRICFSKNDLKAVKRLLMVCFPLFVVGLCYNIIPSLPRLVFERMYTEEEMGYYSSISTIAVLVSTAVNCIMVPLIPKFSEYYQKGNKKSLKRISFASVGVTVAFGLVCIFVERFLGTWALVFMFGEKIIPYAYIFKWVIIAAILTSLIICMNAFFTATNHQMILMIAAVVGTVLCVIFSVPFCKYYYMMGVTNSLIISQLIEIVILAIAMIKVLNGMQDRNT